MILKVMRPEAAEVVFRLIDRVDMVDFCREFNGQAYAIVTLESGDIDNIPIPSAAYVLNDEGRTVESFKA